MARPYSFDLRERVVGAIEGGMSMLGYTITLYTLPVSLFGMSVSASELPAMSSAVGTGEEIAAYLRQRLVSGLRRISFFVVPSAVALAGQVSALPPSPPVHG